MMKQRLPELDGIRGCAIILVLSWHYVTCQWHGSPDNTFQTVALRILSLTWSGVDLFFVLSGFLIGGILLDNKDADNYFSVFYLRRTLRIFPLYLLLLGSFIALYSLGLGKNPSYSWLFFKPMPLWAYATFTQNIAMGLYHHFGCSWLGVTWSLAIEEQFYLVIPLLVFLMPRRHLAALCGICIVVVPCLRLLLGGFHAFVYTPWRADSLLTGVLLAISVRNPASLMVFETNKRVLCAVFLIFLAGCVFLRLGPDGSWLSHLWFAGLYGSFLSLAVTDSRGWIARMLRNPILAWFGITSYGIYIFHQPISGMMHGLFRHESPSLGTGSGSLVTAASLLVTLAMAAISYYAYERKFIAFSHKFQYNVQNLPNQIFQTTDQKR
jgi:peptidoglycan/LPS O-acetylase OafA/YrhL